MTGRPGDQGSRGERGPPGPIIDAAGREIITVKGEKVSSRVLLKRSRLFVANVDVYSLVVRLKSITGSAVALHCCKAHAKINRKIGTFDPL